MNAKAMLDGQEIEFSEGESILQVARRQGLDIPTLCHLEKCRPNTSCLVCLVKVRPTAKGPARMVPSCGTLLQPGMVVESETPEVHEARRTALELLLSDHVGDCLSPCQRICPLQLNIPVMLRQIQHGQIGDAIATVKSALPMAGVLGRLCNHPCENGCRRATYDQAAAIRDLERFVADQHLASPQPYLPPSKPSSGRKVAIFGAGLAGLSAAYVLLRHGHACHLLDSHDRPGGTLRVEVEQGRLPGRVLEAEWALFERMGARFEPGRTLGDGLSLTELSGQFDAVLVTVGSVDAAQAQAMGLPRVASGLKVDPENCRLDGHENVFAAGSCVKPLPQVVRAMAEGQVAGHCVHAFLAGDTVQRPDKPFSSIMGRLEGSELSLFLRGPNPEGRHHLEAEPECAIDPHQASCEAGRCLHCDCRAAGHCALQRYAQMYHAEFGHFKAPRRLFEQKRQPGGVVFEPGKCILCGICVQLAEQAQEPLGLTFVGRGFEVRLATPLNRSIQEGLQKAAQECVEHCPTGALSFLEEDRPPQRT